MLFVMVAEVLIYVPSVSRFRKVYLEDQIAKASLAVTAAQAQPGQELARALAMDLLFHADAYAIVLETPDRRLAMLSRDMPPAVDATFDLRDRGNLIWIPEAFSTLRHRDNRVMRLLAASPQNAAATLEVILNEAPLRDAMLAFSWRILTLSIIISVITAGLVYLSLQWLLVRPIRRMCDSILRFRQHPEDETATMPDTGRSDELGVAQRELARMQTELRAALRQKTYLAALGSAVAKIHHDLRNTLATAVLASDYLSSIEDPAVKRIAPKLYNAISRAVAMCSRTLDYVRETPRPLEPAVFPVADLVEDVKEMLSAPEAIGTEADNGNGQPPPRHVDGLGLDTRIYGDRDQLFRVVANLALNAAQAGATTIRIEATDHGDGVTIDVVDDGPGIPAAVQGALFQPGSNIGRAGGTGLGLTIAREIVQAHGGAFVLAATGPEGTRFRITLPHGRRTPRRSAA